MNYRSIGYFDRLPVIVTALIGAGILSGVGLVKSLGGLDRSSSGILFWFGPGLWFGLVTAPMLARHLRGRWAGALIWIGFSIGSWFVAMNVYMMSINMNDETFGFWAMALAGTAGGLLLAIAQKILVVGVSLKRLGLVGALGGVLGIAMWAILFNGSSSESRSPWVYGLAFAVWQLGVGLAIVYRK